MTRCRLLEVCSSASSFDSSFELVCFVLRDAFLNGSRCALNKVLGFFEAKTSCFTDRFDHWNLVVAESGEDDVKLGLFFSSGSSIISGASHHHRSCSSCRHAPLLFKVRDEGGELDDAHVAKVINDLVFSNIGHDFLLCGLLGDLS